MHHGVGLEKFYEESIYEGEYIYGRKQGLGVYTWKEGWSLYKGFWVYNIILGGRTYYWGDGRRYVGESVDNAICGEWVYTWVDGKEYMVGVLGSSEGGLWALYLAGSMLAGGGGDIYIYIYKKHYKNISGYIYVYI